MFEGNRAARVGDIEVVPLFDGTIDSSTLVDKIHDPQHRARAAALVAAAEGNPLILGVYAFLLKIGDRLVLVDSGAGNLMGPRLGHLKTALGAAGVAPQDVDHIFITHLHRDHYGGLTDADCEPTFPNAELIVHEVEAAYWFTTPQALMPPRALRFINSCFERTAPYRTRGRLRTVADGGGLPGVAALRSAGHTPGHTSWLISSQGETMLVWGDTLHVAAIHLIEPDIFMEHDLDAAMAAKTRAHVFNLAARENMLVAGAHLTPPIGRLTRGERGFRFLPAG
jgi:glyoxylase-like metal-dependent hydrolase (beta-lactamase superfamily II)